MSKQVGKSPSRGTSPSRGKSLFKCKVSCSGPSIVDDVIYVAAPDIQSAIQAADAQARRTSGSGAHVISAEEIASSFIEARE